MNSSLGAGTEMEDRCKIKTVPSFKAVPGVEEGEILTHAHNHTPKVANRGENEE